MSTSRVQAAAAPQARPTPQILAASGAGRDGAVALWLWSIAVIVFLMILVGGATRLTDSGLSITEWQPLLGAIPPLSDADWQAAFAKYREIPEYELVNKGMSLEAFKAIFWWEWGHRFLGRLIGLAFAVPLVAFWALGRLRAGLAPKLAGVFLLGGLQGAIGWYMVKSGLVDRVDVSQYRLALHLTIAFLILGAVVWLALGLARVDGAVRLRTVTAGQRRTAVALAALVLAQVVLGALVAGTKAGLTYNTWPLMGGRLIPEDAYPNLLAPFEDVTTAQFNHRMMAYIVAGTVAALWYAGRRASAATTTGNVLLVALVVQMLLGIWTLIAVMPIWLAALHQAGAVLLLTGAVVHADALRRP